jgi:hypothetical protein
MRTEASAQHVGKKRNIPAQDQRSPQWPPGFARYYFIGPLGPHTLIWTTLKTY